MSAKILEALTKLDVNNDNHWTQDGLPRLDTVKMIAGDQALTREQVTAAAPGWSRASAAQGAAPQGAVTPAPAANPAAAPPATSPETQPPQGADPATVKLSETGLPNFALTAAQAAAPKVAPEQLQEERSQLEALTSDVQDLDKQIAALNKQKAEKQAAADALNAKNRTQEDPNSNQHDIQAYLASQVQSLAHRAEQIKKVKQFEAETGVKLKDLMPKRSRIDESMARKTGYGSKRPGASALTGK